MLNLKLKLNQLKDQKASLMLVFHKMNNLVEIHQNYQKFQMILFSKINFRKKSELPLFHKIIYQK